MWKILFVKLNKIFQKHFTHFKNGYLLLVRHFLWFRSNWDQEYRLMLRLKTIKLMSDPQD